jgi:alpha-tubulin suppressor-like RCC1 family protein
MSSRSYLPLWIMLLAVLAAACGFDSSGMGAGGEGGGRAAIPASETTAEARAALTAGTGSLGNCNGNPARCAAVNLAAGGSHTVALKSDSTVQAWGYNSSGQLGDTTTTQRLGPVQASGLSIINALAAGGSHTVALKSDGTVWAWGSNGYGQLGDGTTIGRITPVQTGGLGTVAAVAAGGSHTVMLKSDGTVWACGDNGAGQLGDNTTTTRLTPVQTTGLGAVSAVATGIYHTVALKPNGTVWAWGYNYYGQLGDTTTTQRLTPVQTSQLSGITAVTVGTYHTVALKSDGTVWAWGYNTYGQLGDTTTTEQHTPVQVSGLDHITAVAAGDLHTVALKSDGTVWAWGNNVYGQLGNATTTNQYAPVQVSGLSGVTAIAAGIVHTVALKSDGTVWSWGYNGYGQLGDNTTTNRHMPTQTSGLSLFSMCGAKAVCDVSTGACAVAPTANGTACNDNNACTQTDTCQAGVCTGSNPVACSPPDQCHTGGVCNPTSGICSKMAKFNNTPCDDGNACTQVDGCQLGTCTGTSPVTCAAPDQCHAAGSCIPATGTCSYPALPDGTICDDGSACSDGDTCQLGICTGNSFACPAPDQCHMAGSCDEATGMCSNSVKKNGTACNDGNECTQTDTCQNGSCIGTSPLLCAAPDQCHTPGSCNPINGVCSYPNKVDGTTCSDSNTCTQTDTCQTGICTGANPVACPPPDQCHTTGVCDAATGICSNPAKAEGSPCNDSNACTQTDVCQEGICSSGTSVDCSAFDDCHDAGICNKKTGACTNPAKAEGSPCDDGDPCTQTDICQTGICTAGMPVTCSASDDCHDAGTCDTITGACSNPAKADGTICSLGTCQAGACAPLADAGADGGTGGQGSGSTTANSGVGGTGGRGTGSPAASSGDAASGTSTGTAGGSAPKATIDLSCRFGAPEGDLSTPAAWVGAITLLALSRRRDRLPRTKAHSF